MSIEMDEPVLSLSLLNELYYYNSENGQLIHKVTRRGVRKGTVAGSVKKDGYVHLKIMGVEYYAHRVIYFMLHGYLPAMVDHKDGNRSNNKPANLRAATSGQNCANSRVRKDNVCGIKGIRRSGKKWRASITTEKKQLHLGSFDNHEQASAAYRNAAIQHHREFMKA